MNLCEYVYCRKPYFRAANNENEVCDECGFPRTQTTFDPVLYLKQLKQVPLPASIWDMHQIIPNHPHAIALQTEVIKALNIEKILIQSVPDKVPSILNNQQLLALKNGEIEGADDLRNRMLLSQFVDPRHPNACKQLDELAKVGIKVIKLIPAIGYYPDEEQLFSVWQTMHNYGMTAMVHTGFLTARHKHEEAKAGIFINSKFGHPIYWDKIARKFPNMNIILCHMGGAMWYEEAAQMVTQHDNVWGDISGFGIFALNRLLHNQVRFDLTKVVWGNDSRPDAYLYNLNLVTGALNRTGMEAYLEQLLVSNAKAFCESLSLEC